MKQKTESSAAEQSYRSPRLQVLGSVHSLTLGFSEGHSDFLGWGGSVHKAS